MTVITRSLVVCAGLVAFLAPALGAQTKVCAFQEKPGHAAKVTDSDADALARELNAHSIQTEAAVGVAKKDQDAEAQKRGCTWVVTLWRQALAPDSPNYAGSLAGNAQQGSASEVMGAMTGGAEGGALLNFTLRQTSNRKNLAQGYSDDESPYAKIEGQIAKKIDKAK
jgi:hypothetical protein